MTIYKQITLNVIVVYCKLGFFKKINGASRLYVLLLLLCMTSLISCE